ncbi:hypothetical protein DFQ28_006868 [Apophysomyces sp. BC1034]|nr:hypothetical protein DFQ30_000004 [Apophysomyces sp. BC1015]KAG0182000.1 hypothetical protein DFQ29_006259 [Apophysomyces sp. BC1021]KAG0192984.1 hypothetical protein DFQ28_006868 [Apophysomyces sp. BC1034]
MLPHTLVVITGASRGFGCTIAKVLASQVKHRTSFVLIGRNHLELEKVAKEIQQDQVQVQVISGVSLENAAATRDTVLKKLEAVVTTINQQSPALLTKAVLINNAGSTGDLSKQVLDYDVDEIQSYVDVNLTSYIVLISGFIRLFRPKNTDPQNPSCFPPDLVVVNISSLLAVQAFPNWGLYATGKSARDMLLRVVAEEDKSVRTLSYAPGPLDNEMQKNVRETLADENQKQLYTEMAVKGNLVSMEASAGKLADLLRNDTFESGAHIDFYDV